MKLQYLKLETPVIRKEDKEVGLTPHGSTVPPEKSCQSPYTRQAACFQPTAISSSIQQPSTTRVDSGSCVKLSPQRGQCWCQPDGADTATASPFPGEHPPQEPSPPHTKQLHGLFKLGTCLYNMPENKSTVPTCTSLEKNSVQQTKHVPGTCTRVRVKRLMLWKKDQAVGCTNQTCLLFVGRLRILFWTGLQF